MLFGVDISHHNPPAWFDYEQLAKSVDFCVVRSNYGVRTDREVSRHVAGCRANGIKLGLYLFYRQSQGAAEQLESFMAELGSADITCGDVCPVVDLEWNERYDGKVDPDKFNTDGRWICEQLSKVYGQCIVYLAPGFFQVLGSPEWLKQHPWWVAHYTTAEAPWMPPGAPPWSMWQYSGKGSLDAYNGGKSHIDVNRAKTLPTIGVDCELPTDDELPKPAALELLTLRAHEAIDALVAEMKK